MVSGKLRMPYRQRILFYCDVNNIVVPHGFDAPKSSDRLVIIDVSARPPVLVKRTTFLESEVIRVIQSPENATRAFKILDFKRGIELAYDGGRKLVKVGCFECKMPGEITTLTPP